jgi:hypothetical protein
MAGKILGSGLFGLAGKALAPKPAAVADTPTPAPTPVMPIADDAKVSAARKRSIAAQRQRQGRPSTILTTDSETLRR